MSLVAEQLPATVVEPTQKALMEEGQERPVTPEKGVEEEKALGETQEEPMANGPQSVSRDFIIHTGNIQRCNHLQMEVNPSLQKEVVTALKCTMHCWNKYNQDQFVLQEEIIPHPKLMPEMQSIASIPHHRINMKLFLLGEYEPGLVQTATSAVLKAVADRKVDRLIVQQQIPQHNTSEGLHAVWKDMEDLHDLAYVGELGMADVSEDILKHIHANSKIKPSVVEIPRSPECQSPLQPYAKEHRVSLIPHDDGTEPVLPPKTFTKVMNKVLRHRSAFTPVEGSVDAHSASTSNASSRGSSGSGGLHVEWSPVWVARYVVLDSERSVMVKTGFTIGGRYTV